MDLIIFIAILFVIMMIGLVLMVNHFEKSFKRDVWKARYRSKRFERKEAIEKVRKTKTRGF